ncbi:MAG: ABC transporter substrate-binding protein [Halobacteriales archaeon]
MTDIGRRRFIKATGAASVIGLSGCLGGGENGDGGTSPTTEAPMTTTAGGLQSRTISVGTLLPVSGAFSGIGQTMEDAAQLAFQAVDSGSEKLSVDAQYGDSQSDPGKAISGANNLANAGVPAVVGAATTGAFLQTAQQVFIPADIAMCSPSATAVSITSLDDKDLAFRTAPSDAFQGRVMAQYATEELGHSTAASLAINDAYGTGLADTFASAFKEMGGTVQTQVSYERGQASYSSRISQAVEGEPDMLVLVAKGGATSIQLLKDYYSDFDPERTIMTVDGMNTARIPNEVGRPLKNVVGTAPTTSGPARDTFDQMYMDAYDTSPGPFNGQTYDAAAVELLANARAGENAGPAIAAEMRGVANTAEDALTVTPENLVEGVEAAAVDDPVNYQGAASPVEFDENGDLIAATFGIWKYAPDTESGFEIITEIDVKA